MLPESGAETLVSHVERKLSRVSRHRASSLRDGNFNFLQLRPPSHEAEKCSMVLAVVRVLFCSVRDQFQNKAFVLKG